MRLYYHLVYPHLSNTYLVVSETTKEGLLIDPGSLDLHLVETIEKNGYSIAGVLTTLHSPPYTDGLPTLMRVYPSVQVFSAEKILYNCSCISIQDGDVLDLAGFKVEVIGMPAYAREAVWYKIGSIVFTGAVLTTGMLGPTTNLYVRALLIGRIRQYFTQWEPETLLFPGYGPPTKAGLELRFNADLNTSSLKTLNSVPLP